MHIKQEKSINKAIHCEEELYRAAARITKSFKDIDGRFKQALEAIVCEKKKQILIDNLSKSGVNVQ